MACMLGRLAFAAEPSNRIELNKKGLTMDDTESDFAVISFYKSSDALSVEIDGLFDGASVQMEKMIEDGAISQRTISWYRLDIDEFPDMALKADKSTQLIISKLGNYKKDFDFEKSEESREANELNLVNFIKEYTGDFVTHVECEQI